MEFYQCQKKLILAILVFITSLSSYSQNYIVDNQKSEMKIEGTSFLHDWQINVEEQNGDLSIAQKEGLVIKDLNLIVNSKSLKSGKSRMDKNTYDALNTDTYSNIIFEYSKTSEVKKITENIYDFKGLGELTIKGTAREVVMSFRLEFTDKLIILTGKNNLKMTDFGIDPPRALFGTIKVGDEITISYKSIFKAR